MHGRIRKTFPDRPKLIFMGTPDFAVPSLKVLVEHHYNVMAVITQPDRPRGRGRKVVSSSVKKVAEDFGLDVLQPEKASASEFCEKIRQKAPDLVVVVAFGQILSSAFLDIPAWGALNIHASLLPKYRGAAPIHWAILNNDNKTGLTAMRMDEGLDSGPILLQEEIPILADETAGQLHDRLAQRAGNFLIKTLKGITEGRLKELPQDEAEATYTSKIDRQMALIRWGQPAQTISALIRALDPYPGAVTTLKEKEIKLFSPRVIDQNRVNGIPGKVIGCSVDGLEVETVKGVVQIRELQVPGKKRLAAKDFLRGFYINKDTILG